MWEQAAGINENEAKKDKKDKKDLAALEKKVKITGDNWGKKSAPTDPNNPSDAQRKFEAAQAALTAAKSNK
jgi:hypothetical protein